MFIRLASIIRQRVELRIHQTGVQLVHVSNICKALNCCAAQRWGWGRSEQSWVRTTVAWSTWLAGLPAHGLAASIGSQNRNLQLSLSLYLSIHLPIYLFLYKLPQTGGQPRPHQTLAKPLKPLLQCKCVRLILKAISSVKPFVLWTSRPARRVQVSSVPRRLDLQVRWHDFLFIKGKAGVSPDVEVVLICFEVATSQDRSESRKLHTSGWFPPTNFWCK